MKTRQNIKLAAIGVATAAMLTISFNTHGRKPLAGSPAADTLTMEQAYVVLKKYPKEEVDASFSRLKVLAMPVSKGQAAQNEGATTSANVQAQAIDAPAPKAEARQEDVKPIEAAPEPAPKPKLPNYNDTYNSIIHDGTNVNDIEGRMVEIATLLRDGQLDGVQTAALKRLYGKLYEVVEAGAKPVSAKADSVGVEVPSVPEEVKVPVQEKPIEAVMPVTTNLLEYGKIITDGTNVEDITGRISEIATLLRDGQLDGVQTAALKRLYGKLYEIREVAAKQAVKDSTDAKVPAAPANADSTDAKVPDVPEAVKDTAQEKQTDIPVAPLAKLPEYSAIITEGERILAADSVKLEDVERIMSDILVILKSDQLDGVQAAKLKGLYGKLYEKGKNEN